MVSRAPIMSGIVYTWSISSSPSPFPLLSCTALTGSSGNHCLPQYPKKMREILIVKDFDWPEVCNAA